MRNFLRRRAARVTALAAVLTLVGGAALAVVYTSTSSGDVNNYFATNNALWSPPAAANTWHNVPGTLRQFSFTTRRMVGARFASESYCVGRGYCGARVVYRRWLGRTWSGWVETHPQEGNDGRYDTAWSDGWEMHALERNTGRDPWSGTAFLLPGTYQFTVQAAEFGGATQWLDGGHAVYTTYAP